MLHKALRDNKAGTQMATSVAALPGIAVTFTEDEMKALSHDLSRQP